MNIAIALALGALRAAIAPYQRSAMRIVDDETLEFSTGKRLGAHLGVIGLAQDLQLYDGFDGQLDTLNSPLTLQERQELADHMIERWMQFKQAEPKQIPIWDD